MRKTLIAFSAFLALSSIASADPIADRKALMKDIGSNTGVIGKIVKGENPFDAQVVQTALAALHQDALKIDADTLFPAGTETGGDTEATMHVWEDRDGFVAGIEKLRAATAAADEVKPQDLDTLRASFKDVGAACGACHETYRVKK